MGRTWLVLLGGSNFAESGCNFEISGTEKILVSFGISVRKDCQRSQVAPAAVSSVLQYPLLRFRISRSKPPRSKPPRTAMSLMLTI
jgi:hypothetical protein